MKQKAFSVSLYAVGHKDFWLPNKKPLIKFLVAGAKGKRAFYGAYGPNIWDKDLVYNEITVLFWVWKNDQTSDIVGLQHYRRAFVEHPWRKTELLPRFIKEKSIRRILGYYDIIVPTRYRFKIPCRERINTSASAIRFGDIPVIEETLREHCPEYLADWDAVMNSRDPFLHNMFIMKRSLMNEYCEWLFPLLFALEEKLQPNLRSGDEQRLMGLISEYFLDVWVNHKGLLIREQPYAFRNNFRDKLRPRHILSFLLRPFRRTSPRL